MGKHKLLACFDLFINFKFINTFMVYKRECHNSDGMSGEMADQDKPQTAVRWHFPIHYALCCELFFLANH